MDDSHSLEHEDDYTTYVFRSNLYFSPKNPPLIIGSSGTTSNSVINDHINENIGSGSDVIEKGAMEKSRIRMAEKKVKAFPPLLSSLNRNGRPKFYLQTVHEEDRLQIMLVPNHFSEVVRTPQDGDRVNMELLETGTEFMEKHQDLWCDGV